MILLAWNASKAISLQWKALLKCRRTRVQSSWCERRGGGVGDQRALQGDAEGLWTGSGERADPTGQRAGRRASGCGKRGGWGARPRHPASGGRAGGASPPSASHCVVWAAAGFSAVPAEPESLSKSALSICTAQTALSLFSSRRERHTQWQRCGSLHSCAFHKMEIYFQCSKTNYVEHTICMFSYIFPGRKIVYSCTLLGKKKIKFSHI